MKKRRKIFMYLIIILVLIACVVVVSCDKNFSFNDINERKITDKYIMQISYPIFNKNWKINREIKRYVNNEKKEFLKLVKKNDINDNQLNIGYSYTEKDSICSFHIRTYSLTGDDNKYYRSDKIFYFDKRTNKAIQINELITSDKIYEVFRNKALDYLNKTDDILNNEKRINKELEAKKDNYKIVMFSNDYVHVILKNNYINRELIININYNDVANYLNRNYFNSIEIKSVELVKNEIPKIRDKKLFNGKKLIALTFDDGPSYDKTKRLIDELDKRNARVSFFMLGEHAIKQPELVKDIYVRGHTIGSHTYDHKQLTKLEMNEVMHEVNYTNEIIKNITEEDVKYLRPPYGSYNKEMLEKIDMSFILWNVDVEDWKLKDEKKIANYIIENVNDGDIVLLHDIHNETIEGVIKAIDELQKKDFAFVSIDELISYKKIILEKNMVYRFLK